MTSDIPESDPRYACMMCGSDKFDATDSQKEFDGKGGSRWNFWTYCKACDCWTEHFDLDQPGAECWTE